MRARSVWGLIISRAAAPEGPSIRPPAPCQGLLDVSGHGDVEGGQRPPRLAGGIGGPGCRRRRAGTVRGPMAQRPGHVEPDAAAEDRRALDHGRQFAHVAGPGVGDQQADILGRRGHRRQPQPLGAPCRAKWAASAGMSAGRSRKRRQADREDGQAIPQVLAEPPVADHLRQVAVGRGHDPDVDVQLPLAADPLERAVLEDPQQPHLGGRGQLAALVEEERAAVGPLEPTLAASRPRR